MLHGAAPPETYAAVLHSLVLETAAPGGLAAGERSVSVQLQHSAGAESAWHSVMLAVQAPPPPVVDTPVEPPTALPWTDLALDHGGTDLSTGWIDAAHLADAAALPPIVETLVLDLGLPPLGQQQGRGMNSPNPFIFLPVCQEAALATEHRGWRRLFYGTENWL